MPLDEAHFQGSFYNGEDMYKVMTFPIYIKGGRNKKFKQLIKDAQSIDYIKEDRSDMHYLHTTDTMEEAIQEVLLNSTSSYIGYYNNKPIGIYGYKELPDNGGVIPWMLSNGSFQTNKTLMRKMWKTAKGFLKEIETNYKGKMMVANYVASTHLVAHNFLKRLGFTICYTDAVKLPQAGISYLRFYL